MCLTGLLFTRRTSKTHLPCLLENLVYKGKLGLVQSLSIYLWICCLHVVEQCLFPSQQNLRDVLHWLVLKTFLWDSETDTLIYKGYKLVWSFWRIESQHISKVFVCISKKSCLRHMKFKNIISVRFIKIKIEIIV